MQPRCAMAAQFGQPFAQGGGIVGIGPRGQVGRQVVGGLGRAAEAGRRSGTLSSGAPRTDDRPR